MFNPRFNSPFGGPRRGRFGGSAYQYQTLEYASPMASVQAGGLVSKVMALLATSFLVAVVGAFIGASFFAHTTMAFGSYLLIVILGFVTLIALQMMINVRGWNLALLFLFMFLEGLGLAPLIDAYLAAGLGSLLGQALLITALTSGGLSLYAWTTKHNFTRLGDYLFLGLLILLVASLVGIFFHSIGFALLIAVFGVALFCGYILYYVQRAKYLADTLPNAIGLTVSLFLAMLNLFLFILEILAILNGGRRR